MLNLPWDLDTFAERLRLFPFRRIITEVHVHHTWRPRRADFRGAATIEAIRRYHTQTNRWADIAQHITIDPSGGIWPGRDWNRAPASATGHNGTARRGPFMIEMIGDFDTGQDPFDGPQREVALSVCALLLDRFRREGAYIRFHRQMSAKSCPGSSIDYDTFCREVEARRTGRIA